DTILACYIKHMHGQWNSSAKDNIFHNHYRGNTIDSSFYVGPSHCPAGKCSFKPRDADWQTIAISASGQPVTLSISGTAGMGQPVATVNATLHFSPDDVKGGLYYFSPSINGLKRVPFGAAQAQDYVRDGGGTGCAG